MPGDYERYVPVYGMSITDVDLPTANPILIAAKSPSRIVTVQRITFVPAVYVQATLTFSDSVTGTIIGTFDVPATKPQAGDSSDMLFLEYGPTGTKLAAGSNLLIGVTANGASGRLHIEAYQKGPLPGPSPYVAPRTAGFTA